MIANFWWGQKEGGERKIHWVSQQCLGLPKQEGGMRFQNLKFLNLSLLAKQCWCLIHELESLEAKVIKGIFP